MTFTDTTHSSALAKALGLTRATSSLFARLRAAVDIAQRHRRLQQMPPHLLRDIGMTDSDIAYLKSHDEFGVPNAMTVHQMR